MTLYYLHPNNIKILWNAICKHPLVKQFHNLSDQQQWFEQCLNRIQSRINQDQLYGFNGHGIEKELLNQLNQETILYMVQDLKSLFGRAYEGGLDQKQNIDRDAEEKTRAYKVGRNPNLYQNELIEKQREFESLMQPNKPQITELPIQDKDEPIKNMDELIKLHIQSRELEIAPRPPIDVSGSIQEIPLVSVIDVQPEAHDKKHVTFGEDIDQNSASIESRITALEQEIHDLRELVGMWPNIVRTQTEHMR